MEERSLNPFRAGRCLSTEQEDLIDTAVGSQSLSSRAMSFDTLLVDLRLTLLNGLNPFRAGRCLSTALLDKLIAVGESQSLSSRAMSFDSFIIIIYRRFNVSIPFEQGDVFRQR